MKKMIFVIVALSLLLLQGCNEGIKKVRYSSEDMAVLDSLNSQESSQNNAETASGYEVAGNNASGFPDDLPPSSSVQSSKPVSSAAPLYNRNEELVFDDKVLEQIIRDGLSTINSSYSTSKIKIEDVVDWKFESIKITNYFTATSTYYVSVDIKIFNNTVKLQNYWGKKISNYNVLSKMHSLKKIEIYYQNNTMAGEPDEYKTPFWIDISPIFKQKSLENFTLNLNIGPSPLTLKGVESIGNYSKLNTLNLIGCGITDTALINTLKQKQPNANIKN